MSQNLGQADMRLYVNIDHVATVRQARRTDEPDPIAAARLVETAGADGITVHLREDRRHIQDADVRQLAASVHTVLNLELAAVDEIIEIATEVQPYQATLVPERREEITTEGGLDLGAAGDATDRRLRAAIARLSDAGIHVSLFIDPDANAIDRAADLAAPAIELHTGAYANSYAGSDAELNRVHAAAERAASRGLAVHAGHGLTYRNVQPVAAIAQIEELNIGHSIVSRAVMVGLEQAVREMKAIVTLAQT